MGERRPPYSRERRRRLGVACAKIIMAAGAKNIVGCDSKGIVHEGREDLNESKRWFAENTNPAEGPATFEAVAGPTSSSGSRCRTCSPSSTSRA